MLTCKVGEKIINTFEYDDEQIRKWSNKGILKCPVCDSTMIFKNGEIKIAHFAHEKDADCEDIYSESETEEHLIGKKMIYQWLSNQTNISNIKLEAWIPETKQRPDIYFEIGVDRYVIEFQCTPIATEYLQRRRLYELAGIHDIWILGVNKYNININNKLITHHERLKEIEKYNNPYLDVSTNMLILSKEYIKEFIYSKPLDYLILNKYEQYLLQDLHIDSNSHKINANEDVMNVLLEKNATMEQKVLERLRIAEERRAREEILKKENELKYNDRKKVFDSLESYINNKYNYSKFTTNIVYRSTKKGHSKYTNGFPCLNYFYSDFMNEHRLYLNNFNLSYPGNYIQVKDCDNFNEIETFLENQLDFNELYTLEELIKIDGIIEQIRKEFDKYIINVEIRSLNELYVSLNYYSYYDFKIYQYNKKGSIDISNLYTEVYNNIQQTLKQCENESFKLKLVGNFIRDLNYRYDTKVDGNWSIKRVSNTFKILKENTVIYKNIGTEELKDFKTNAIDFESFKLKLENEISNSIRDYIYKGGI